jgi:hypothetical protein
LLPTLADQEIGLTGHAHIKAALRLDLLEDISTLSREIAIYTRLRNGAVETEEMGFFTGLIQECVTLMCLIHEEIGKI